jgi:hypothetical protein
VYRTSAWARAGWIALALYVLYAASRLEIIEKSHAGVIMAGEVMAAWARAAFLERGKVEEE